MTSSSFTSFTLGSGGRTGSGTSSGLGSGVSSSLETGAGVGAGVGVGATGTGAFSSCRVPIINWSAFSLTAIEVENSLRSVSYISSDTLEVGLLSISNPFSFRKSTIVDVPTFSSLAILIRRFAIYIVRCLFLFVKVV